MALQRHCNTQGQNRSEFATLQRLCNALPPGGVVIANCWHVTQMGAKVVWLTCCLPLAGRQTISVVLRARPLAPFRGCPMSPRW
jgi:hypothetical protein